jgi:fumarylacetoacetase
MSIDTPYPHLLKENPSLREMALVHMNEVETHLPLEIGDYTDFAGINHAFNVGTLSEALKMLCSQIIRIYQ